MLPLQVSLHQGSVKKATHTYALQIMSKVEVIPGDLAKPQCGISEENQTRLLPEVQYVIHAAASIQFDNPIHTDLTLSYVATKTIADFAAKVGLLLLHSWSFTGNVTYLCSLHISGISRHTVLTWQRLEWQLAVLSACNASVSSQPLC